MIVPAHFRLLHVICIDWFFILVMRDVYISITVFMDLFSVTCIKEKSPDTCGAAKLVPIPNITSKLVSCSFTLSAMIALTLSPPGAAIEAPQLL
jgi:hypothetical protein